jgi:hypothetical protein
MKNDLYESIVHGLPQRRVDRGSTRKGKPWRIERRRVGKHPNLAAPYGQQK